MREVALSTAASGVLLGASWSDGVVVAFGLGPGTLWVVVRNLSGGLVRVEASGVREVTVGELWDNAILLEFVARRASAVPEASLDFPDDGWGALIRRRGGTSRAEWLSEARSIAARRPEPLLFEVQTAYGGRRIAAVCDGLRAWDGLRSWDERPPEA